LNGVAACGRLRKQGLAVSQQSDWKNNKNKEFKDLKVKWVKSLRWLGKSVYWDTETCLLSKV
jgi:hypothetical protein